jgi:hypothetical protein
LEDLYVVVFHGAEISMDLTVFGAGLSPGSTIIIKQQKMVISVVNGNEETLFQLTRYVSYCGVVLL